MPIPTMIRNDQKMIAAGGCSVVGDRVQPGHRRIGIMLQQQAAELRNADRIVEALFPIVGQPNR